jgi:hypothetical protein
VNDDLATRWSRAAADEDRRLWIGARLAATVEQLDPLLDGEHELLTVGDGERVRRIARAIALVLARQHEVEFAGVSRFDPEAARLVDWRSVAYSVRDFARSTQTLALELAALTAVIEARQAPRRLARDDVKAAISRVSPRVVERGVDAQLDAHQLTQRFPAGMFSAAGWGGGPALAFGEVSGAMLDQRPGDAYAHLLDLLADTLAALWVAEFQRDRLQPLREPDSAAARRRARWAPWYRLRASVARALRRAARLLE